MRNAGITVHNFSHGSDGPESEPPALNGSAREIPSFHTHAQYTNTSELRNPLKRVAYRAQLGDRMSQAVKPPLMGVAVLPASVLNEDGAEEDGNNQKDTRTAESGSSSISKFSLFQYAQTGAVYAQDIEMVKNQESNYNPSFSSSTDHITASGNTLDFNVVKTDPWKEYPDDVSKQLELMDKFFDNPKGWVAPWKRSFKEQQALVDEPELAESDVREHIEIDITSVVEGVRKYLLIDREITQSDVDIELKVREAMKYIDSSAASVTM